MNTASLLAAFVVILQIGAISSLAAHKPRRTKRTLLQMCELIQRYTNRGCLEFNDYGCYCGWGNAGAVHSPMDGVDTCCMRHDSCYGEVTCMWFYPQFVGYNVECDESGHCQCQDSELWSPCARSTCECDLRFAECLGRAEYHSELRNFNWRLCEIP